MKVIVSSRKGGVDLSDTNMRMQEYIISLLPQGRSGFKPLTGYDLDVACRLLPQGRSGFKHFSKPDTGPLADVSSRKGGVDLSLNYLEGICEEDCLLPQGRSGFKHRGRPDLSPERPSPPAREEWI